MFVPVPQNLEKPPPGVGGAAAAAAARLAARLARDARARARDRPRRRREPDAAGARRRRRRRLTAAALRELVLQHQPDFVRRVGMTARAFVAPPQPARAPLPPPPGGGRRRGGASAEDAFVEALAPCVAPRAARARVGEEA